MFKTIIGFPAYMISDKGDVLSVTTGKLRKPHLNNNGYYGVFLYREDGSYKYFSIHRLVAEAFVEKPEGYEPNWEVNHKDHNKHNNNADNLEWMSHRDNCIWDMICRTRRIDKPGYKYHIYKDDELVATVTSLAKASKVVGISKTRVATAIEREVLTSTGYWIVRELVKPTEPTYMDIEDIGKKRSTYKSKGCWKRSISYNCYYFGELVKADITYQECAEISGLSTSAVRHNAKNHIVSKSGWYFTRNYED